MINVKILQLYKNFMMRFEVEENSNHGTVFAF